MKTYFMGHKYTYINREQHNISTFDTCRRSLVATVQLRDLTLTVGCRLWCDNKCNLLQVVK